MGPLAIAAALTAALIGAPARTRAVEAERPLLTIRTSLKGTTLLGSRAPDASARIRVEPELSAGAVSFSFAYEQRVKYNSSDSPPFFRIRPLDWLVADSRDLSWRHEIDRASLRLPLGRVHVTAGRQAVGWGRGVMFGAVDLFAPFSPLEPDREWRRGIDAVRADVKLGSRSSLEAVAAFGETWDGSALVARARGYAGRVDLEVMGGRRATDLVAGASSSAAVGGAEIHGEAAAFWPETGPSGRGRAVWKGVAGGSYRFPVGTGLLMYAEYHYSGFGLRRAADIVTAPQDPVFAERILRGDTQIRTRHAAALMGVYEWNADLSVTGRWLHNPADGSGIVAPAATMAFSDRLSMLAAVYLSYGRPPSGARLASEYGAVPWTAFLQLRVYFQR